MLPQVQAKFLKTHNFQTIQKSRLLQWLSRRAEYNGHLCCSYRLSTHGLNPPHTHPRGIEILTMLEGSLYVGFVTSNPDNRLFTNVLNIRDVFVPHGVDSFPVQLWSYKCSGTYSIEQPKPWGDNCCGHAVFGSRPSIPHEILAKAFQVDKICVDHMQAQF